jgi:hypothetical protein
LQTRLCGNASPNDADLPKCSKANPGRAWVIPCSSVTQAKQSMAIITSIDHLLTAISYIEQRGSGLIWPKLFLSTQTSGLQKFSTD